MIPVIFLAATTAPAGEPPMFVTYLPLILIFGVFYFLLIRPQQKKQKEHDAMVASMDKNHEVVTSGGIHGTVVQVKETTVLLRIADNVRIEVDKIAIARKKGTSS